MISISSEFAAAYRVESHRLVAMVNLLKLRVQSEKSSLAVVVQELDKLGFSFSDSSSSSSCVGFQAILFCRDPLVASTLCVPIEHLSFESFDDVIQIDKAVWMTRVRTIQSQLQKIVQLNVELANVRASIDTATSKFEEMTVSAPVFDFVAPGENV